jgi:hypothetical protein
MIPVREFDPGWLLETDIFSAERDFYFLQTHTNHTKGDNHGKRDSRTDSNHAGGL